MTEEKKKKIVVVLSYITVITSMILISSGFMYLLDRIPQTKLTIEIYKWIVSIVLMLITVTRVADLLERYNNRKHKENGEKTENSPMKIYDE